MKRPAEMKFEDYKQARKELNAYIKQRLRGVMVHVSKAFSLNDKGVLIASKGNTYVSPSKESSNQVQSSHLPNGSSDSQGQSSPSLSM